MPEIGLVYAIGNLHLQTASRIHTLCFPKKNSVFPKKNSVIGFVIPMVSSGISHHVGIIFNLCYEKSSDV